MHVFKLYKSLFGNYHQLHHLFHHGFLIFCCFTTGKTSVTNVFMESSILFTKQAVMFRYCRIVRNTIIIDLKQQIDMILPFISCCADWNYNILIILLLHNIYVDANVAVRESINDFLLTAIHLELNCIPI